MVMAGGLAAQSGVTVYGYLYSSTTDEHGFVEFDSDNPGKINILNKTFGKIHPSAGEYVDGKVYCYLTRLGNNYQIRADSWAVYDGTSYAQLATTTAYGMHRAVDMAYDYTTNAMYALIEESDNSGELGATRLCAVDMATGGYTVVGSPTGMTTSAGDDALIALACNDDGQLYAMSANRYLYVIDKHSAEVCQVGNRHNLPTARQFQSMAFAADGQLWWAQQHPAHAYFCTVDTSTAIPGGFVDTSSDYGKLSQLGDDDQVTALHFKDKAVRPRSLAAVGSLQVAIVADNEACEREVRLTWKPPTVDYSGAPATPSGIEVYRLGVAEPIAVLAGDVTSWFDNPGNLDVDLPAVDISYEVIAYNEAGYGFPAFATIASNTDGVDAPCADSGWNVSVGSCGVEITSAVAIASASIVDLRGRTLLRADGQGRSGLMLDTVGLGRGVYVVVATAADGHRAYFKVML